MAQPKRIPPKTSSGKSRAKKAKQPTQFTSQERVQVMGPSGKLRLEWRSR